LSALPSNALRAATRGTRRGRLIGQRFFRPWPT